MLLQWLFFTLIVSVYSTNKLCPGSTHSCPDSATCCELPDKSYGCCPLENAVCCDDHIHCCPENTKCAAGICIQSDGLNTTAERLPARNNENTSCFGSNFSCPDFFTCCKSLIPGVYGCCPLADAVCCSDGYRCCPHDTVCDVKEGRCLGKGFVSEMYDSLKTSKQTKGHKKYTALTKLDNLTNVICPGSSFQCPNGYTCCKLPTGNWGCCPFINAVCCNDHLHCCPSNMHCDVTSQSCSQGLTTVPSGLKELSKPVSVGITCPDNSTCAESMTCCEISNEHFGCCPYIDAVCCEDHSHCCPDGYICDMVEKSCIPRKQSLFKVMSKYYKKLG